MTALEATAEFVTIASLEHAKAVIVAMRSRNQTYDECKTDATEGSGGESSLDRFNGIVRHQRQVLELKEEEMRRRHLELSTQSTTSQCINDTGNKGQLQASVLSDGTPGGGIRDRSSYGIDGRRHDFVQTPSSADPSHPCSPLADNTNNVWAAGVGDDVMVPRTGLLPCCVAADHHENVATADCTTNSPLIADETLQGNRAVDVRHYEESEKGKGPERTSGGLEHHEKGLSRDPAHRETSRAVSQEAKDENCVRLGSHRGDASDDSGCGFALAGTQQHRQRCSSLCNDSVQRQLSSCGSDSSAQVPCMKTEYPRSTSSSADVPSGAASNHGVAEGQEGRSAAAAAHFSDESWSSSGDDGDCTNNVVGTPTSRDGARGGGNDGRKGCALDDDWAGSEAYGSDDDCTAYDEHERASVRLKAAQAVTSTRNGNSSGSGSRAVARQPFGAGVIKIDAASDVRYGTTEAHGVARYKKMGGELAVDAASKSSGKTGRDGLTMRNGTTIVKGSDGSKLRKIREARHLARHAGHCAGQFQPELPLDSSLPPQGVARRSIVRPLCYYNKYSKGRAIVKGDHLRNRLLNENSTATTVVGVPPSPAKGDLRNHNRRRRWVSRERNDADDDSIGNPVRFSCTDPERQHRRGDTDNGGGGCVGGRDSHSREDDDARLAASDDGAEKTHGASSGSACRSPGVDRGEGACGQTWVEREFRARLEAARQEALEEKTATAAAAAALGEEHSSRTMSTYLPGIVSRGRRSVEGGESADSTVKR